MKIIEGSFSGKGARIVKAVFGETSLEIRGGMLSVKRYSIPDDFKTLKLINKDESRTFVQFLVIALLAMTLFGIPIAILLFILWKRVDFSVGMETRDGEKFIARGDAGDWKVIRKYLGVGSLDSF